MKISGVAIDQGEGVHPMTRMPERLLRLIAGLFLYGFTMAMMVESTLGLDPWDVFHQGLAAHLPLTFGQVVIIVGAVVLLLCATVLIAVVRERMYTRRMMSGKAPYRLPWNLRLNGWHSGECPGDGWQRGLFWDIRFKKYIPITRVSSQKLRRIFPA